MDSEVLQGIGTIVVLGIGLQWVAHLLHFPSIVLLLAGGLVAGPVLGLVDADQIFGDSLFPVISLAVALLLFNGALDLRLADLHQGVRRPVTRLVTVGTLVTWLLTTITVHLVFDESPQVSILLGAILVVSGPTVVGPLLRLARPKDPDATILQWEGIVIDPIGATLGVFCLNAFFIESFSLDELWADLFAVALSGVAAGIAAATLLVVVLRLKVVPDELEVAVAIMFVVAAYVAAEIVRPEAGLFATTVMGVAVANQPYAPVRQLRTFGEPVVALLIGGLFMVLASTVELDLLREHLPETMVLVAVLVLVVRPAAVAVCTIGATSTTPKERMFLACVAPRGVVAASTAALYSLRLEQLDEASDILVPVTFSVIIALAIIYGIGSPPAARWLGVKRPDPTGALILSGERWAVSLAEELSRHGIATVVVARGRNDLARTDPPFTVYVGLIHDLPEMGVLSDVRGAIVASRDDETNFAAITVLAGELRHGDIWLLPSGPSRTARMGFVDELMGWTPQPFSAGVTHDRLHNAMAAGHRVRTVDAAAAPPDAMVLARLRPNHWWSASVGGSPVPGEQFLVLDPAPVPAEEADRLAHDSPSAEAPD